MKRRECRVDAPRLNALVIAIAAALAWTTPHGAWALPHGEQVVAGSVVVNRQGAGKLLIQQGAAPAILNWQGFSIDAGESVRIQQQQQTTSVLLNRVVSRDPSRTFGQLTSNGSVFLINPSGVLFGASSVDVGSLVVSTLGMADADFLAGRYRFCGDGGSVVNHGTLSASERGTVALLGGSVSNDGRINARLGTVALAAGSKVTLDLAGDGLSKIVVTQAALDSQVANGGAIVADGGAIGPSAAGVNGSNGLNGSAVSNPGAVGSSAGDGSAGGAGIKVDNGALLQTPSGRLSLTGTGGLGGAGGNGGNGGYGAPARSLAAGVGGNGGTGGSGGTGGNGVTIGKLSKLPSPISTPIIAQEAFIVGTGGAGGDGGPGGGGGLGGDGTSEVVSAKGGNGGSGGRSAAGGSGVSITGPLTVTTATLLSVTGLGGATSTPGRYRLARAQRRHSRQHRAGDGQCDYRGHPRPGARGPGARGSHHRGGQCRTDQRRHHERRRFRVESHRLVGDQGGDKSRCHRQRHPFRRGQGRTAGRAAVRSDASEPGRGFGRHRSAGGLSGAGHTVALATEGPLTSGGPIVANALQVRGGAATTVNFSDPRNAVNTLAVDPPASFAFVNSGPLRLGPVSAGSFANSAQAAGTSVVTDSASLGGFTVQTLAGALTLDQNITTGNAGANITLAAAATFNNPGAGTLRPGAAGRWWVWADTWVGENRGGLAPTTPNPNFYGCAYGAAGCASNVTLPAAGNHFIYFQRPRRPALPAPTKADSMALPTQHPC